MRELQPIIKEQITHTQLVRYAGASGDFNPIHTVVPIAEKAGLSGAIAHGMLVMGMVGQALTTWFSPEQLRSFQVRFAKMTFPGEQLTINGKINKEQDGLQTGELFVVNETGEVKLKGKFTVII